MADEEVSEKPTHRCPRCGGTSRIVSGGKQVDCPECTPYGPFGLVPQVVAIDLSLREDYGETELRIRNTNAHVNAVLDWLLHDHSLTCPPPPDGCGGSGYWVNPTRRSDRRPCFKCNCKGVLL